MYQGGRVNIPVRLFAQGSDVAGEDKLYKHYDQSKQNTHIPVAKHSY